jgi:hypothetical protein
MTPDSGFFPNTVNSDLLFGLDGSYMKYINTFIIENDEYNLNNQTNNHLYPSILTSKNELNKLSLFELNELIDQFENNIKDLSETLVQVNLELYSIIFVYFILNFDCLGVC